MAYSIIEVDQVVPENSRFPVTVHPATHALNGPEHTGQVDDNQIPSFIMRDDEHQLDPHTMIIDGRDVSVDGAKLDTIETGAEVNNISDQQAASLTSGTHSSWHHHDDWYYRKSELFLPGQSMISWENLTGVPTEFSPTDHNHDDRYYTENEIDNLVALYYTIEQLDNGQLDNRYYTEIEVDNLLTNKSDITHLHDDRYYTEIEIDNFLANKSDIDHTHDDRYYTEDETDGIFSLYYSKTELDAGQLNNIYYTEGEIDNFFSQYYSKTELDDGQLDNRYYTENEVNTILNSYYSKTDLDGGQLDNRYFTETEITTNYYDKIEVDAIIAGIETFGIKAGVDTYADLPGSETDGAIYIVRQTVGGDEEGFYKYDGGWTFLSRNTGNDIGSHNELQGLNSGDYLHLTAFEYSELTGGVNTNIHNHDDRYYTEAEIDNFLDNISPFSHNHDDRYYTETEMDVFLLNKSDITHNHDDRYFTKTEITTNYYSKAELNAGQLDNRYYTETEINNLLVNKSDINHNHDDRYYTENEMDTFLLNKSDIDHIHDDRYFTELEITSNYYSKNQLNTGQLDNRYYTETEIDNLLANKSDVTHTHNDLYYGKSYIDQLASMYSLIGHNHDERYYQEVEVDGLLAAKSDNGHIHDDRYFTETELSSESGTSGAKRVGVSLIGGITATNVQDALQEIQTEVSSSANTLNESYHAGREITADEGPVKIEVTTQAPLQITNMYSAPVDNLAAGQIAIVNNELYVFDISRNKWLTPTKNCSFGRQGSADGHTLMAPGGVRDNNAGYKMAKNGTLMSIAIHSTTNVDDKDVYIRINGSIVDTVITGNSTIGTGDVINTLNIDFNAGDILSILVSSRGRALKNTTAMVEYAWRV